MGNVLIIARKDFSDLIGNHSVLMVLFVYFLMVICSALYARDLMYSNTLSALLLGISYSIRSYGSIIGLVIGFSVMTGETIGGALNTLAAKPLYRDTIITGKILSCTVFILCVFGFVVIFYTALMLVLCGDAVGNVMGDYLCRLPFVLLLVTLNALFYMFLSIFISIIVKRPGVALLLSSVLFIFLDQIAPSVSFAGNIGVVLGNDHIGDLVAGISPVYAWGNVMFIDGLSDATVSLTGVLNACWPDLVWLFLYVVILLFVCYTVFIRRDIS